VVLPDGCLDLMWLGGELVVAGPDTGPVPSSLAVGTEIAAVRFRPGAAPAVLGVPASELRDRRVPLVELWSGGGELSRRVDAAADPAGRVAVLETAVRRRLADAPSVDPVALAVAAALGPGGVRAGGPSTRRATPDAAGIAAPGPGGVRAGGPAIRPMRRATPDAAGIAAPGPGGVRAGGPAIRPMRRATPDAAGVVAALAARAGLSERQLHRRCLTAFGYGAKTLDRVLRLQRFLALGRANAAASLAELAAAAGYADQAHLGHDCRALAGATPTELLA
jgi:AraC-like DNA-binding protein